MQFGDFYLPDVNHKHAQVRVRNLIFRGFRGSFRSQWEWWINGTDCLKRLTKNKQTGGKPYSAEVQLDHGHDGDGRPWTHPLRLLHAYRASMTLRYSPSNKYRLCFLLSSVSDPYSVNPDLDADQGVLLNPDLDPSCCWIRIKSVSRSNPRFLYDIM